MSGTAISTGDRRGDEEFSLGIGSLFRLLSRNGALLGYIVAGLAIYFGWLGRDDRNITAASGLGYALGIIGGVAMVVLPSYSLRKRYRFMHGLGATRYWFQAHMMLGVVGPVIILFHSNFTLGDLNSRIALYCMLLVAGSGIIGRYLYAQIHLGLYGRRASLADMTAQVRASLEQAGGGLFRDLHAELAEIDGKVMAQPRSLAEAALRPLAVTWQTWSAYRQLARSIRRQLAEAAAASPTVAAHQQRLGAVARRHVRSHLGQVRQVALFSLYERLFALWHVVHIPFFIMLILSAVVHVVAVHLY